MTDAWRSMNQGVSTKTGYGINWVAMRYSDILLMYAEVVNELYGPQGAGTCGKTAQEALAEVRERAFPASVHADKVTSYVASLISKEAFFEAIVDERAWELAGEAVRKYDLIRWGLLIDKTVEMLDTYRNAVVNDEYVSKLYYKENAAAENWYRIDYSSICWYEEPETKDDAAAGWKNVNFWGNVKRMELLMIQTPLMMQSTISAMV